MSHTPLMPKLAAQSRPHTGLPPNVSLPVPLLALERPRPYLRVRQLSQWAQELPIGNTSLGSPVKAVRVEASNIRLVPSQTGEVELQDLTDGPQAKLDKGVIRGGNGLG